MLTAVAATVQADAERDARKARQDAAVAKLAVDEVEMELAAALYDPAWTSAIQSKADFGRALAAFGLLFYGRVSTVFVVLGAAIAGWVMTP